jgi:peroxiredoxin
LSLRWSGWLILAPDAGPLYPSNSPLDGVTWVEDMTLQDRLDEINRELLQALDPIDRAALEAAIERLRMLQLVEQGLGVGDVLPDFALPDRNGRVVTSEELLERGPLVMTFFRGPWCPYCSLTLEALNEVRSSVERSGGSVVAVAPLGPKQLGRLASERGLGLQLLSDPDAAYAQICGVRFEMTEGGTQLYARLAARFGLVISGQDAEAGWQLPIPATYVADSDGIIGYAFGDADWSRRADPVDIVAAVERLA